MLDGTGGYGAGVLAELICEDMLVGESDFSSVTAICKESYFEFIGCMDYFFRKDRRFSFIASDSRMTSADLRMLVGDGHRPSFFYTHPPCSGISGQCTSLCTFQIVRLCTFRVPLDRWMDTTKRRIFGA